ncbi:unnamed protein product [Ectocarpus sp. 8 AP-2014]
MKPLAGSHSLCRKKKTGHRTSFPGVNFVQGLEPTRQTRARPPWTTRLFGPAVHCSRAEPAVAERKGPLTSPAPLLVWPPLPRPPPIPIIPFTRRGASQRGSSHACTLQCGFSWLRPEQGSRRGRS